MHERTAAPCQPHKGRKAAVHAVASLTLRSERSPRTSSAGAGIRAGGGGSLWTVLVTVRTVHGEGGEAVGLCRRLQVSALSIEV